MENYYKELRIRNKLTQDEAATQIGVTVSTIQNWENGRAKPELKILSAIANVYKTSTIELIRFLATSLEYDDTSRINTSRDKFKLYKYILPSSLEVDILNEFYLNETELEVFKTMYYCHIHSLNIFEMLLIKFKDIYTIEHALSKLSKLRLIMYYRNCNNFFQDCTFKIQHAANILFFETANNSDKYFDIINLDFTGILNYLADYSGEDQMKLFREFSILHWFVEEGVFFKANATMVEVDSVNPKNKYNISLEKLRDMILPESDDFTVAEIFSKYIHSDYYTIENLYSTKECEADDTYTENNSDSNAVKITDKAVALIKYLESVSYKDALYFIHVTNQYK